ELIVINQEMISLNEQVTEARNYAEAIVTTIKEPLIILDKNLRVKSANQSFYRTFMASESETEGKRFFELGDRQWDIPDLRAQLENIIPDKQRFSDYEVKQIFPGIGERIMLLNAREMKEETGSEKLILLAIEDITDKRVAEYKLIESEKKFRNLADFIPQIIWTAQPNGSLDYYNQQWYTFTKFDEGQADQSWIPLLHDDDKQRCIAAWYETVKSGEPYQIEYRFKDIQTGGYRWFLAKAAPIKDQEGRITKWFGSFTDIHEQKIVAGELLKAKELAELLAKTADGAVRSKQQFLSNMSHEIRTPMNSIIGFTKVLLRTPLTDKQKEYLNAIKISGDVLIVLINDILDLAKVDAGKMNFEKIPFKLADTVSSMLHLFEIKLREKNIELVKDYDPLIPEVLSGDPVRLHQVILNLMSNAVKFTGKGKITMGVRMLKEDEEKVEIEFSIADTGIGIPQDKISLIFDNFEQAHMDKTRVFGGTGLGLSIVKKLLEAQGGTIQVKSKLKVGSVFTFVLSFQKTNEKPAKVIEEEFVLESAIKNIKVLVVEDIPLNQLLMKTVLVDFGFQLDIVDNGKMAIEKLAFGAQNPGDSYDIVLMDLQMPEMNGFEAAAYIRNELHLDIPIIALSADVTQDDLEKSKTIGMNDYISKPVDEKLLFNKIINLLKTTIYPDEINILEKGKSANISNKCTDLAFLKLRTRSDTALMIEMIHIYLDQTPSLISAMKKSMDSEDWSLLRAAAHKIFPSFAIMGIDKKFQNMTKSIQEYNGNPEQLKDIQEMVFNIEAICKQACKELEEDLTKMNTQ
ncbi:MAG: ATP-binding protein, partial [Ferruginibacter sp.]